MSMFKLTAHEIDAPFIGRNMPVASLYEEAIHHDSTARLSGAGALVAYSGEKTGRSPKDKRIVKKDPSARRHLVGHCQRPDGSAELRYQSRACQGLSQHTRSTLLF